MTHCRTQSDPAVIGTFEAHVRGVESDKRGLPHVAGELLSQGFWVGGGQRQHLLVFRQRGENPAAEQEQRRQRAASVCHCVHQRSSELRVQAAAAAALT